MRIYLAVQSLSNHVIELIDDYAKDNNDLKDEYSTLSLVIKQMIVSLIFGIIIKKRKKF